MAQSTGFKGTLDALPLHSVLYAISSNAKSGTLTLEAGGDTVILHLSAGAVTSVTTSDHSLRIGRLLLDQGFVTEEQIEQALALQSVAHDPDRIGEVLIDVGFVTPEQIKLTIAAQLEAALFRILIQDTGVFKFAPSEPADPQDINAGLFLEPIVLNAMYLADEWLARHEPADVRTLPDQLIDPEVMNQVPEPERGKLDTLIGEYDRLHEQVWESGSAASQVKEIVERIFERAMVRIAFLNEEDEALTGRTGTRRQLLELSDEFIDPWILIHLSKNALNVLLEVLNGKSNLLDLARSVGLHAGAFNKAIEELVEQELITVHMVNGTERDAEDAERIPNYRYVLEDIMLQIRDLDELSPLGRRLLVEILNGHDRLHAMIRHTGVPGGAVMNTLDHLVGQDLIEVVPEEEREEPE
jgi:hypothetical protein